MFIVTDTIDDAARIARECQIKSINLGGTKSAKNKTKLSKAIYVTEQEKKLLQELLQEGIELNIQMIPSEKKIHAESVLN